MGYGMTEGCVDRGAHESPAENQTESGTHAAANCNGWVALGNLAEEGSVCEPVVHEVSPTAIWAGEIRQWVEI